MVDIDTSFIYVFDRKEDDPFTKKLLHRKEQVNSTFHRRVLYIVHTVSRAADLIVDHK